MVFGSEGGLRGSKIPDMRRVLFLLLFLSPSDAGPGGLENFRGFVSSGVVYALSLKFAVAFWSIARI